MIARPVTLLHLSDPHLFADESRELYGVVTAETFAVTLKSALASAPGPLDAVVVTGDIADDGCRPTYERFRSIMDRIGVPVLCAPGNHEDPAVAAAVLDAPPLGYCGSTQIAGWRLVMLSSHVPDDDSGWLADDELGRLERELGDAGDEHVLVCLHHQPVPVGSPWLDGFGLGNAASLHEVLARHSNVRGVLFGHAHQAFEGEHAGRPMLGAPSTCAQFEPKTTTCVMDLSPPGFRWLRLSPSGGIESWVEWVEELRRSERPPDSRSAVALDAGT